MVKNRKVEFYYGAGYLSQSTRNLNVPTGVVEIEVFNSKGESRKDCSGWNLKLKRLLYEIQQVQIAEGLSRKLTGTALGAAVGRKCPGSAEG
jgi:hypothetical protein